jgi:hypothetical protein
MDNSGGLLSTNNSYTLRGSGQNGIFDSPTCDALSLDDRGIPMVASYEDQTTKATFPIYRSVLAIDPSAFGGSPSQELFRLEICVPFTDLAGNQLQPPGKEGALYSKVFRIETLNPFVDGNFDCGVISWGQIGGTPALDDVLDHQASPDSGSMLMIGNGGVPGKGAGDSHAVDQCIELPSDAWGIVSFRYRVDALSSVDTGLQCTFVDAAGCGGSQVGFLDERVNLTPTGGQWATHSFELTTPVNTSSARCFIFAQDELLGLGYELNIDAVKIDLEVFSDGFEGNPVPF